MASETISILRQGLEAWSIRLTPAQERQFDLYAALLVEWNEQRMNLTRLVSPREIAVSHFLDSLALFQVASVPEGAHLLDIGTGAGFPGLPAKIFRPDIKLTLLEATAKKLTFCRAVVEALGLRNVSIAHGRAEDWARHAAQKGYDRLYDVATARAVAPMSVLLTWAMPYVALEGVFVAWKGAKAAEEIVEAAPIARTMRVQMEVDELPLPQSGLPPVVHSYILCRYDATGRRRA